MTVEFTDRTVLAGTQRTDVKKPVVGQPEAIFEFAGIYRCLHHRAVSPHCATGQAGLWIN
jgi:hypothetical protein